MQTPFGIPAFTPQSLEDRRENFSNSSPCGLPISAVQLYSALRFTFLLCALALTTATALSAPPPERTLKHTGDLLLLPVSDNTALKKGEETADAGLLEVIVDGMLVHRVNGIFPRKVKDAKFWAFLDMKEFAGKHALLRIPRGPAVIRGAEILGWMDSSDRMRHTQPILCGAAEPRCTAASANLHDRL
jgi:hypothetical protein